MQIKHLLRFATKIQRHSKSDRLTVEDINIALRHFGQEEVYGLSDSRIIRVRDRSGRGIPTSIAVDAPKVSISDFARSSLPRCPLAPDIALHWLLVEGVQPKIPENPRTVAWNPQDHPTSLSREMQYYYTSTTNAIRGQDMAYLPGIFKSFSRDSGLQDLIPYYCRFVFQEVRSPERSLPLLLCLMKAVGAFVRNPHVQLQYHLHQIMPAVFTCVVGASLSPSVFDDHWALRREAAQVVASIVKRYESDVTDLHVRVCKTYIDAFQADKSLFSVYGGIVGLVSLGQVEIKCVLIPSLYKIRARLSQTSSACEGAPSSSSSPGVDRSNGDVMVEEEEEEKEEGGDRTEGADEGGASSGRPTVRDSYLQAVSDEEAKERCREALGEGLGRFMMIRARLHAVFDEGFAPQEADATGVGGVVAGLLLGKSLESKLDGLSSDERQQAASCADVFNDLAEVLVPYHVTTAKTLDFCRMMI